MLCLSAVSTFEEGATLCLLISELVEAKLPRESKGEKQREEARYIVFLGLCTNNNHRGGGFIFLGG